MLGKTINICDIKRLIKSSQVNYVAYAVTPWHLIGAKAAYLYLKSKGLTIKPLFIINEHKDGRYYVREDNDVNIYYRRKETSFDYLKYSFFLLCNIFRNKRTLTNIYIACAWSADFKLAYQTIPSLNTNFSFILFEEGASQYRQEYNNLSYLWRHLNKIQFVNKIINIKLGRILENKGMVHYFTPYNNNKGHLVINNQVVDFYKEVQHISSLELNTKRLLIAMQSFQMEEINTVKRIAPVLENSGYEVLIKEHPRYPLMGYGLDKYRIDSKGKGLEAIVPELAPRYIISFWSTTLLTMNYFYSIIPISLYLLLDHEKMDTEELQACHWFYDTFKDVVRYPKSIDELNKELS